jgi:dTDP-4-amino-4,6-dideoxygalactose transaminase
MPAFAAAPTVSLPNSDLVAARTLGLPMFRDIDETHFDIISESLPTPM